MKLPLVSPSFDQKEQNCLGHPQFYSSIVPMILLSFYDPFIQEFFLHYIRVFVEEKSLLIGTNSTQP